MTARKASSCRIFTGTAYNKMLSYPQNKAFPICFSTSYSIGMLGFPDRSVRSSHSPMLIDGKHAASAGLNVADATHHEAAHERITTGVSRMTTLQGAL
jgi:hypothetical protein